MTRTTHAVALAAMFALMSIGMTVAAQQLPYRVGDQQVKDLLRRIDTHTKSFRGSFDRAIDRTRTDGGGELQDVKDFEHAVDRLSERVNGRRSSTADVEDVLRRAALIDSFVIRNHQKTATDRDWQVLRRDLDDLARAYNVAWNRSDPRYGPAASSQARYHALVGTYRLDSSRSDNPRQAAEQAARAVSSQLRQGTYQSLITRLESPNVIAIDRNENTVTIASSREQRTSFEANGQVSTERGATGSTISTSVKFLGDRLVVTTTTGDAGNDFTVTFEPTDEGRTLDVTRTVSDENLRQPVTVKSFYRKSSNEARLEGGV